MANCRLTSQCHRSHGAKPWLPPSDYSEAESVIITIPNVPNVPEAYKITYEVIDSGVEIIVSWSEVNCISYNLYKEIVTETKGTGFVLIEEGLTSTSYSEIITEIGKYTYKVSAVNDIGESEQSNPTLVNLEEIPNLGEKFYSEIEKVFMDYKPTPEDSKKLAELMSNPVKYEILKPLFADKEKRGINTHRGLRANLILL